MSDRPLDAVLFDLDGTLLEIDLDRFWPAYTDQLARLLADLIAPDAFLDALKTSTNTMMVDTDPTTTNRDVFWADFLGRTGLDYGELEPRLDEFYERGFAGLAHFGKPAPLAREAVLAALDLGVPVAVATNPIMPRRAVDHRLDWAGLGDVTFSLVTTYENMHACKPSIDYFREVASLLGVATENCLMVGDDEDNDLVAMEAGMQAYIVERAEKGHGVSVPGPRGSMADVLELLRARPRRSRTAALPRTLPAAPCAEEATAAKSMHLASVAAELLEYLLTALPEISAAGLCIPQDKVGGTHILARGHDPGEPPEVVPLARLSVADSSPLSTVLASGRSTDVATPLDRLAPFEAALGEEGLAAPIRHGHRMIAAAAVYAQRGRLDDGSLAALQHACENVAPLVAASLKVCLAETELESHRSIVDLAARFGRTIAKDELTGVILEAAMELTLADSGSLMLTQPASDSMRITKAVGLPERYAQGVVRYGEGIAGWVARTGQGMLVEDRLSHEARRSGRRPRSGMSVPMIAPDGTCRGVVSVGTKRAAHRFAQPDLQRLTTLAELAALALVNADELALKRDRPAAGPRT